MDVRGEISIAGGAVMCLVFEARSSTKDVDAQFKPVGLIREAAVRVSQREGISDNWLNDGVAGYLSDKQDFVPFLELSHLRVLRADARFMLAMKCMAMRVGEGYSDIDDVRYLLRNLGIESYGEAAKILDEYYGLHAYKAEKLAALRELIEERGKRAR